MDPKVMALVIGAAAAVGVGLFMARQAKANAGLAARIREELAAAGTLSLPELVTRLGLPDGIMSRGKVISAVNPLVAKGDVVQEEPPGTTMKNRLDVLRFRLKS